MQYILKILSSLVVVVMFSLITAMSFFSASLDGEQEGDIISMKDFPYKESLLSGALIKSWENYFDTIYSGTWVVEIIEDESVKRINVDKNRTLSSFRNMGAKYVFEWKNFSVEQLWIWEVFIDTLSYPWKAFVLSMNTPLSVKLLSDDGKKQYTEIFLAPHMYLEFQPFRGKFLDWADRVRVETVYSLWYIGDRLLDIPETDIAYKYILWEQSTFKQAHENLTESYNVVAQDINDFQKKDVVKIPGLAFIERYGVLFLNKTKQIVYYKNAVLEGFIQIMNSSEYDAALISRVESDLQSLQALDRVQYDEVQNIWETLLWAVSQVSDRSLSAPREMLYFFVNWERNEIDPFLIYWADLFSSYDAFGEESENMFINYIRSFAAYVSQVEEERIYEEYFLYFLEKKLLYMMDKNSLELQPSLTLETLKLFNTLALEIYSSKNDLKLTGIYIYNELLLKIEKSFFDSLFSWKRNESQLLERSGGSKFSANTIVAFEKEVDIAFDFYEENKTNLDLANTRDANILKSMNRIEILMEEYFIALDNYEEYVSLYDTSKRELRDFEIIWSNWWDDVSEEKALEYLSQFVWLSLENLEVSVEGNLYYVKNLVISWRAFNFTLHPKNLNKLTDIVVDGEDVSFEYKLDFIEQSWEDKFETADAENKSQYDFTRFFLITFFENTWTVVNEFVIENTVSEEDKTEIIFKRDILLWEFGEFSSIKNFVSIDYNDIRLEKEWQWYNIYLENSEMKIATGNKDSRVSINSVFSGQYVANTDDQQRYFTSLNMVIQEQNSNNTRDVFSWIPVRFTWRVQIETMAELVEIFGSSLSSFERVFKNISEIEEVQSMSLQYNTSNNKMLYKFEKGGKSFTILASIDSVEQALSGTTRLIESAIEYDEISQYIN